MISLVPCFLCMPWFVAIMTPNFLTFLRLSWRSILSIWTGFYDKSRWCTRGLSVATIFPFLWPSLWQTCGDGICFLKRICQTFSVSCLCKPRLNFKWNIIANTALLYFVLVWFFLGSNYWLGFVHLFILLCICRGYVFF